MNKKLLFLFLVVLVLGGGFWGYRVLRSPSLQEQYERKVFHYRCATCGHASALTGKQVYDLLENVILNAAIRGKIHCPRCHKQFGAFEVDEADFKQGDRDPSKIVMPTQVDRRAKATH